MVDLTAIANEVSLELVNFVLMLMNVKQVLIIVMLTLLATIKSEALDANVTMDSKVTEP
jgi:hypothetical protein